MDAVVEVVAVVRDARVTVTCSTVVAPQPAKASVTTRSAARRINRVNHPKANKLRARRRW
jgi:hypothetical protein